MRQTVLAVLVGALFLTCGKSGSDGNAGAVGPSGAAGAKGETGAAGAAGTQGIAGATGYAVKDANGKRVGKAILEVSQSNGSVAVLLSDGAIVLVSLKDGKFVAESCYYTELNCTSFCIVPEDFALSMDSSGYNLAGGPINPWTYKSVYLYYSGCANLTATVSGRGRAGLPYAYPAGFKAPYTLEAEAP